MSLGGKLKKSQLIITALLIVFAIAIVGGMSKIGRDSPPPVSSSSSSKNSSAAAAPKGPSSGITMTYRCTVNGKPTTLHSLKEVWEELGSGCVAEQSEGAPNFAQAEALRTAYGSSTKNVDKLVDLFQLCASTTGASAGTFSGSAAKKEMLAALKLCPGHPNKAAFAEIIAEDDAAATASAEADKVKAAEEAKVKAEADAKKAQEAAEAEAKKAQAVADAEARKKAYADGTRVDDGNYLVGTDVQPGTWQTVATKVTECYWEISDAQGNILANNFINTAPQFTIAVPATASGFTVSGCSFQRIGD